MHSHTALGLTAINAVEGLLRPSAVFFPAASKASGDDGIVNAPSSRT